MTLKHLSRDPFSRIDCVRDTIEPVYRKPCAWCGSRVGRFMYGTHSDSTWGRGGTHYIKRTGSTQPAGFCSVGCARSYGFGE